MNEFQKDVKGEPQVGKNCVFPFQDGYGGHNGCRKTEGFEEDGLEGTNFKVIVREGFILFNYPLFLKLLHKSIKCIKCMV